MYEDTTIIIILPTNNNQPVVLEDHTRLTLRETIRTLFLGATLDHVYLALVPIFPLDVVPEVVELYQKIFRTRGDALRSRQKKCSLIVFEDRAIDCGDQFLRELDDTCNFKQKFADRYQTKVRG
jgi:hypothetical protein